MKKDAIAKERTIIGQSTPGREGVLDSVVHSGLLEAFPDLCFVVSDDGKVLDLNNQAATILRSVKKRLLATEFTSMLDPSSRDKFQIALAACMTNGQLSACKVHFVSDEGRTIEASLRLSRYPSDHSTDRSVCIVVAHDLTEEKRKELDLLRFSNIAHFTVNPLEVTDASGKIIYVNPAFERASGYAKEELIGRNPNIFSSGKHPKSFWKKMWDTINSGRVWVGEIENRRRSGESFFTQLLISPILDAEGSVIGYFGIHRDITEQRQLQQQLIHAQKMESIGLLAAGLAHEVGNPLTSISSLVQIIQRETKDGFTQEKLEMIRSQISRISRIIRDLVDFSRRSSYEVQMTDVNKSLNEAVEIVRVGKKAKVVAFHVRLEEHVPRLSLVPDQIEQVFINILINAVDAIHDRTDVAGSVPPSGKRGEIMVTSSVQEEHVIITIQDTGKGIPEEVRPKIFEPFFTTKPVGEGTGLGLWVSYGIIKSFRGMIDADSVEGVGTTFIIKLPLHPEYM